MGIEGVAWAGKRSEWAKSQNMTTMTWKSISADGLKPTFFSGEDVSTFPAMSFDLDSRTEE